MLQDSDMPERQNCTKVRRFHLSQIGDIDGVALNLKINYNPAVLSLEGREQASSVVRLSASERTKGTKERVLPI